MSSPLSFEVTLKSKASATDQVTEFKFTAPHCVAASLRDFASENNAIVLFVDSVPIAAEAFYRLAGVVFEIPLSDWKSRLSLYIFQSKNFTQAEKELLNFEVPAADFGDFFSLLWQNREIVCGVDVTQDPLTLKTLVAPVEAPVEAQVEAPPKKKAEKEHYISKIASGWLIRTERDKEDLSLPNEGVPISMMNQMARKPKVSRIDDRKQVYVRVERTAQGSYFTKCGMPDSKPVPGEALLNPRTSALYSFDGEYLRSYKIDNKSRALDRLSIISMKAKIEGCSKMLKVSPCGVRAAFVDKSSGSTVNVVDISRHDRPRKVLTGVSVETFEFAEDGTYLYLEKNDAGKYGGLKALVRENFPFPVPLLLSRQVAKVFPLNDGCFMTYACQMPERRCKYTVYSANGTPICSASTLIFADSHFSLIRTLGDYAVVPFVKGEQETLTPSFLVFDLKTREWTSFSDLASGNIVTFDLQYLDSRIIGVVTTVAADVESSATSQVPWTVSVFSLPTMKVVHQAEAYWKFGQLSWGKGGLEDFRRKNQVCLF